MAPMDKRELSSVVSGRTGICRADVELVITELARAVREAVTRGENISIRGFGTFKTKKYKEQSFFQPKTGVNYVKAPRRIPTFHPVKGFIDAVQKADIPA